MHIASGSVLHSWSVVLLDQLRQQPVHERPFDCDVTNFAGITLRRFQIGKMGDIVTKIWKAWHAWDAVCSEQVRSGLAWCGFTELLQAPSPVLADMPFVSSPTPLVTAIIAYLAVIFGGLAFRGNKQQDGQESALLKGAVRLHNAFLIVLSTYMCATTVKEAVQNNYTLWGNAYNPRQIGMANVIYVFYLSKIYEFFDTVRPPTRSCKFVQLRAAAQHTGGCALCLRPLSALCGCKTRCECPALVPLYT
jgi:GNS1/SUR4 family